MSNKVILPMYNDNGELLESYIEVDSSFFVTGVANKEFNGKIIEPVAPGGDISAEPIRTQEETAEAPEENKQTQVGLKGGWYEFIKMPSATTHIAYLGDDRIYLPEEGVVPIDFFNAVDAGTAYRLVREKNAAEL